MFFNPFKKSESPNNNQGPATNEYVVKNEPKEERKPKTMEDTLTAKLELDELKKQRLETLSGLRTQKDEIRAVGVAEFENENHPVKRTETFNDLVNNTEAELAEISQKIGDIRNEFNFTPSHVERLIERSQRVNDYIESIKQKMAPEYRAVESKINNFFGPDSFENLFETKDINAVGNFIRSLNKDNADLPEVKKFLDKIHGLNAYENSEDILTELKSFRKEILKVINEKTFYKTPGEVNEAYSEINRGIALSDEITKMLSDAKNKQGDFKNQKGYF